MQEHDSQAVVLNTELAGLEQNANRLQTEYKTEVLALNALLLPFGLIFEHTENFARGFSDLRDLEKKYAEQNAALARVMQNLELLQQKISQIEGWNNGDQHENKREQWNFPRIILIESGDQSQNSSDNKSKKNGKEPNF